MRTPYFYTLDEIKNPKMKSIVQYFVDKECIRCKDGLLEFPLSVDMLKILIVIYRMKNPDFFFV